MNEMVMLEIPEDVARRIRQLADYVGMRMEDLLVDWLKHDAADLPLESLPDDQILHLCDMRLPSDQQAELSQLLFENQEGVIDEPHKTRLSELIDIVQNGTLFKAHALEIAVKRGLNVRRRWMSAGWHPPRMAQDD